MVIVYTDVSPLFYANASPLFYVTSSESHSGSSPQYPVGQFLQFHGLTAAAEEPIGCRNSIQFTAGQREHIKVNKLKTLPEST